jgi:hypothetical protein
VEEDHGVEALVREWLLELDQVEDLLVLDVGAGDHVGRTTTAVP